MSLIAFLFARYGRVALAAACLIGLALPASAQSLNATPNAPRTPAPAAAQSGAPGAAQTPAAAQPAGPPVRQIIVQGTQRIEPGTVLSYLAIHEGDAYDEVVVDRSLKTLFATGLFADVKFNWDGRRSPSTSSRIRSSTR